tara:strand:- start:290 stop:823 length:534 start_codon:yes stop_codon:yes gene_type:complete
MGKTTASIRYAKALFQLASSNNSSEEVLKELKIVYSTIKQEEELFKMAINPTIKNNTKQSVFTKIFSRYVGSVTMKFLNLVIGKGRAPYLLDIIEKYEHIYNIDKKISVVEVISAEPIPEELKEKLKEKASINGGEILLKEKIDKKLIGGFIIKRGDLQYDASIRKKINSAKRAFKL